MPADHRRLRIGADVLAIMLNRLALAECLGTSRTKTLATSIGISTGVNLARSEVVDKSTDLHILYYTSYCWYNHMLARVSYNG